MKFFKSLFKSKDQPINSYSDFWDWFLLNEKKFHKVVKNQGNIKRDFFDKLTPKLDELKDGFWFLTGMFDNETAELILTADGVIKNIVFVEDLVRSAPKMSNWKITALKRPFDLSESGIEMEGFKFGESEMSFYSTIHETMPDEIDITITHKDFCEENKATITNGVYLSLDNFLGELHSVTSIDNVNIINPKNATQELVPFSKLKDFLIWREKEFVEKYEGFRHKTENDTYSGFEAKTKEGLPVIAIMNTDLLNWDSKASHPWITVLEIKFNGEDNNGMPYNDTYKLLDKIEEKVLIELKDSDGFLNVGRQTLDSSREVYFSCIDFRKPSLVLDKIKREYQSEIEINFDIYKDKYWQSFNRFT